MAGRKLYYHLGWSWQRIDGDHARRSSATAWRTRTPSGWQEWERKPEDEARLTTRVECAEYFDVRDEALLAHATQIDPDGFWFAVPREVQAEAWPTEDYQLVRSHVETVAAGGRPVRRPEVSGRSL